MADLLQVKNLQTSFFTPEGEVRAIDGVSFEIDEGKTSVLSASRLRQECHVAVDYAVNPVAAGKIVGGEIIYRAKTY
jgi:ABC-type dipeptide/oligopeptide/nickel transport system ATPase component